MTAHHVFEISSNQTQPEKKDDDEWFRHWNQTKQMEAKLSKPPQATAEHEMIFSCRFDGFDNTG